ncbi:phage tail protein [Salinicola corii]|uniref:Phage tail protein n=1 Tax=Salinicola corii TaxID=2606937 RepID=A0A640W9S6_9GAMM|nr:phage tail protein [Salinicola corii]
MSEPFLGQICLVGYPFAQRGFALCQGQLMPIAQNSALFSLLGTIYGGDGRTTFALPDLSGRMAIGQGEGGNRSRREIGSSGGSETTTLSASNLPPHNHTATLNAETGSATVKTPSGMLLGLAQIYTQPSVSPNRQMSSEAITINETGDGEAFNSMPPYLVLNYEIALQGIFPSRE